jgi:hypothetical protein
MNIFKSIFNTFDIQLLLLREGLLNSVLQLKNVTERVTIIRRTVSGDRVVEEVRETMESTSNLTKMFGEPLASSTIENGELYTDTITTERLKE